MEAAAAVYFAIVIFMNCTVPFMVSLDANGVMYEYPILGYSIDAKGEYEMLIGARSPGDMEVLKQADAWYNEHGYPRLFIETEPSCTQAEL